MNSGNLSRAARCSDCAAKFAGRGTPFQQRTFSSSAIRRKHGAVPSFTEVSSPELQELLTRVRERLFLPAHVSQRQRDLIFKPKYKESLETEPAIATIAGEEFRLRHLNAVQDVPGKQMSLRKAMELMKDKKDWDNIPNLLKGLTTVKYAPASWLKLKLIRTAGAAGRQDVILECLRRADETGLFLVDPEFVVQVFFWMQQRAIASEWSEGETKKALKWAEMVKELMDEPKHKIPASEGNEGKAVAAKPKDQPEVTGILLELAAVRAAKHQDGKDVDGKVEKYAKELLATPVEFKNADEMEYMPTNYWLSTHAPVLHGIKVAQSVLGQTSEASKGLKANCDILESLVMKAKDRLISLRRDEQNSSTGSLLYEKLLRTQSF